MKAISYLHTLKCNELFQNLVPVKGKNPETGFQAIKLIHTGKETKLRLNEKRRQNVLKQITP